MKTALLSKFRIAKLICFALMFLLNNSASSQDLRGTVSNTRLNGYREIVDMEVLLNGNEFQINFDLKGEKNIAYEVKLFLRQNGEYINLHKAYGDIGVQGKGKKLIKWNINSYDAKIIGVPTFIIGVKQLSQQTSRNSSQTKGVNSSFKKFSTGLEGHLGTFTITPNEHISRSTRLEYDTTRFKDKGNLGGKVYFQYSLSSKKYLKLSTGLFKRSFNFSSSGNIVFIEDSAEVKEELSYSQKFRITYGTADVSFNFFIGENTSFKIGGYVDIPLAGTLEQSYDYSYRKDYAWLLQAEDSLFSESFDDFLEIKDIEQSQIHQSNPLTYLNYGVLSGITFHSEERNWALGFDFHYSLTDYIKSNSFQKFENYPVKSKPFIFSAYLKIKIL